MEEVRLVAVTRADLEFLADNPGECDTRFRNGLTKTEALTLAHYEAELNWEHHSLCGCAGCTAGDKISVAFPVEDRGAR